MMKSIYKYNIPVWLNKVGTLHSQFQLVEFYLKKGNIVNAQNILNAIGTNYELNENELIEFNAYSSLFNFKVGIAQNNMSIHELSEAKKVDLREIASTYANTYGGQRAQNALCFFYNECLQRNFDILPPQNKKGITPLKAKAEIQNIKVYPNPAKDHVTFQLVNNDGNCTDCRFFVSDLQGRKVYEGSLDILSGLHVWDTKDVAPGTYIYEIKTNVKVESGKITIVK